MFFLSGFNDGVKRIQRVTFHMSTVLLYKIKMILLREHAYVATLLVGPFGFTYRSAVMTDHSIMTCFKCLILNVFCAYTW